MGDFEAQIKGYRLTTAEIIYRLPDRNSILQLFVLQQLDIAPKFPELEKFLGFWEEHIEGPIHSVRVASVALVKPSEFRLLKKDGVILLH